MTKRDAERKRQIKEWRNRSGPDEFSALKTVLWHEAMGKLNALLAVEEVREQRGNPSCRIVLEEVISEIDDLMGDHYQ